MLKPVTTTVIKKNWIDVEYVPVIVSWSVFSPSTTVADVVSFSSLRSVVNAEVTELTDVG